MILKSLIYTLQIYLIKIPSKWSSNWAFDMIHIILKIIRTKKKRPLIRKFTSFFSLNFTNSLIERGQQSRKYNWTFRLSTSSIHPSSESLQIYLKNCIENLWTEVNLCVQPIFEQQFQFRILKSSKKF